MSTTDSNTNIITVSAAADVVPEFVNAPARIVQPVALRLQLAAIAGNEPATSMLEIRPLDPPGRQRFISVRELDVAASLILRLASQRNVHVGACPRVRRCGTAEAVVRAWCLWADCDDLESVERLRRFRPLPSIVVRSGTKGHVHAWWPLRQAIAPAHAVRANRRLALALGADRAATDAARVMRPIGTLNHKHSAPVAVDCARLELDVFTVAEVVGGLADDPAYRPAQKPQQRRAPRQLGAPLDGLVRHVRSAIPGDETGRGRNASLNWAAYRAGEHVAAGRLDAAEAEGALLAVALDVGLNQREAQRTIASGLGAVKRAAA